MNLFMQKNGAKGYRMCVKVHSVNVASKNFSGFGSIIMIEIRFKPATHCFKQNKRGI